MEWKNAIRATVLYTQIWGWTLASFFRCVLHAHKLCTAWRFLLCTPKYLNSTKWPFFLLSQEWHPVVLVLLAYHISSWSLVRLNEVWLGNFKWQETLISFRISFTTAVSHCSVGVAELFYLADFIQEDGGLEGKCWRSELLFIQSVMYVLFIYRRKPTLKSKHIFTG